MRVFVRIHRTHQEPVLLLKLLVSSNLKKKEFLPLPLPPSFSFLLPSILSLIFKNHICVFMCPHKWRLGRGSCGSWVSFRGVSQWNTPGHMGSKRLCHLSPQLPNVFLFVCFCLFIYLLFIYFEAGSYCAALAGLRILVPLTQPLSMAVNTGSTPWLAF